MESTKVYLSSIAAGIPLYALLMLVPYNYIVAPLAVGVLTGLASFGRGKLAMLAGALAGIAGLLVAILATKGYMMLGLATAMVGENILIIMLVYHLTVTALTAYLVTNIVYRNVT